MATVPAVLGSARLGNFRLGYQTTALAALRATTVRIFINGVESRARVRVAGFTIHDALNDDPNTCTLTVDGSAPVVGQALRVTINSDTPRLLFNGTLQTVALSYEGLPANWAWACSAIDDLARLNRRLPFGTWTTTSATTIAQALIASYAPGFSSASVAAALSVISINLDGSEGFSGALRQIVQLIGGYFYVEDLVLHLFLTEATDTPDPIQVGYPFADTPAIVSSTDLSQLRTRVYGKGHGEPALVDVAIAETILPIANTVMFSPTGGLAISLTDRLAYTGRQLGGPGTVVGPSVAPVVAPTLTAAAGAGLGVGVYKGAYTFVTAAGESLPSPLGSVSTSAGVTTPSVAPTLATSGIGGSMGPGTYEVLYNYSTILDYGANANANVSTGQSLVSPSASIVTTDGNAPFAQAPTSSDPRVVQVNYWVKVAGTFRWCGSQLNGGGQYISNSLTGTPTGVDGSAGQQIALSAIATGPTGTTSRKIYRTVVNGAQLKLQQTIANNTATTGVQDATADGSLGANAPTTDTSALTQTPGNVQPGAASILTPSASAFAVTGGWAQSGQQVIRYTGISGGNTLTGIPAAGAGAIVATLNYGDHIDALPALTGVTGIDLAIPKGQVVNIWVQRDDVAAQTAQAALDGGDGIYEYYVSDERRGVDSLTALCDAHLDLYSRPIVTVTYATRDVKTKSGKTIVVNLSSPPISQTLTIQDVTITEIDVAPHTAPKFTVTASTVRQSLESILRRMTALLD
jgi:hypothetical protein